MNKIYIYMLTMLIACTFGLVSCTDSEDLAAGQYGYVQFKLYKTASVNKQNAVATRAVDKLEYLADAHKIKVLLKYDGNTIVQTMVLNSYNTENAEYGLRSDKLRLLAGKYSFVGYTLYDKLDKELLSKDMQDIKKYIDKYKTDLPQDVFDSQEYSIKLLQIPKISNSYSIYHSYKVHLFYICD